MNEEEMREAKMAQADHRAVLRYVVTDSGRQIDEELLHYNPETTEQRQDDIEQPTNQRKRRNSGGITQLSRRISSTKSEASDGFMNLVGNATRSIFHALPFGRHDSLNREASTDSDDSNVNNNNNIAQESDGAMRRPERDGHNVQSRSSIRKTNPPATQRIRTMTGAFQMAGGEVVGWADAARLTGKQGDSGNKIKHEEYADELDSSNKNQPSQHDRDEENQEKQQEEEEEEEEEEKESEEEEEEEEEEGDAASTTVPLLPEDTEIPLSDGTAAANVVTASYQTMMVAECVSVAESREDFGEGHFATSRQERENERDKTKGNFVFVGLICGIILLAAGIGVLLGLRRSSGSGGGSGTAGTRDPTNEVKAIEIKEWADLVASCATLGTINATLLPAHSQERLSLLRERNSLFGLGLSNPCSSGGLAALSISLLMGVEIYHGDKAISEMLSISTFFFSMDGPNWLQRAGWLDQGDYCIWHGMECTLSGFMSTMDLKHNHLHGTLGDELYSWTELQTINLASNQIFGSIKPNISQLVGLQKLVLTDMRLDSTMPTELGLMTQLTRLEFSGPGLSGQIPSQISFLTGLTSLETSGGFLVGGIPTEFGQLTNLKKFYSRSQLIHSVPDSLIELPSLQTMVLSSNNMNLNVTDALKRKTSWRELSLSGEVFSGSIPSDVGDLSSLNHLLIQASSVTGTLPSEIGFCTSLTSLNLGFNFLVGSIPAQVGDLELLRSLTLGSNFLTGPVPTELSGLTLLTELFLEQRSLGDQVGGLTGSLPASLCRIESLERLTLNCNSDIFLSCPKSCCSCEL